MLSVVVVDESEIDGPPEAKNLAENLELKVYTVNHGYRFIAINRDQKASFTITFDLSKCDNLTIQPNSPDATFGTKEGCPEGTVITVLVPPKHEKLVANLPVADFDNCLLYTSDAADEEDSVDIGGRRIIKKKKRREK
eukprot:TRINITY_DN64052_c0_g1_i1.p2 TRINITY_DN64052_c0_g1~~TRINITY_DN64052_c0_g1_i1.p2  ORF type:complete len:138 (+),score=40.57 TRINITY_DN64052_c0_g1_i1:216-629(+)